jgi:hypothetical protein
LSRGQFVWPLLLALLAIPRLVCFAVQSRRQGKSVNAPVFSFDLDARSNAGTVQTYTRVSYPRTTPGASHGAASRALVAAAVGPCRGDWPSRRWFGVEIAGDGRHGRWGGFGQLVEHRPGRHPWLEYGRRSSPGGAMTGGEGAGPAGGGSGFPRSRSRCLLCRLPDPLRCTVGLVSVENRPCFVVSFLVAGLATGRF